MPVQTSSSICHPSCNGSGGRLLVRVWETRVLRGFGAFVLQFGAQGIDSGGEETILARIWWSCGGIWRAGEQGRARTSGRSGVPHEIEKGRRWGAKRRPKRPHPAANGRCGGIQPGEEISADPFSLSYSLSTKSSVFLMCPLFSRLTQPGNTCSKATRVSFSLNSVMSAFIMMWQVINEEIDEMSSSR